MRAWIVDKQGSVDTWPLKLVERPVPQPGPGDLRLQVEACGICHTDLHIAEGDIPLRKQPVVPGHQIVGIVDAIGQDVQGFSTGDRVGVTWLAGACGECDFCRSGHENLCENAGFTGYDVDGGYAEYTVVKAAFTVRLPKSLRPVQAAPLLCAGIIGYRSLRLADIEPGQRLGLVGFGASAHLAIQVAAYWQCEVYVFTRSEHHRRQARALGAAWAGGIEDNAPGLCDAMVLFAPVGSLVPKCLSHLQKGGTLAINAIHLSDIPTFGYPLLYGERTMRSVSHLTRNDAEEFLVLAAEIPIEAEYEVFDFTAANEALQAVADSQINGAAVLALNTSQTP